MSNSSSFLRTMRGGMIRITGLDTRRWAASVLDEIVEGAATMSAQRHPLGFLCLPVERLGDQGVCVHVWSDTLPRATPTTSVMHAHSWDLISYVLYGRVCNQVFAVTDAAEQAMYRVFEVRSARDVDEIRPTSRLVRCEVTAAEVNSQGDRYTLPAGVFHATAIQGEAATVALGLSRPGTLDLSLGGSDTRTHRVRRERCDPDETAVVARMVLQRLADQEDRCRP